MCHLVIEPQDGRDSLGVPNCTAQYHLESRRERNHAELDHFVGLRLGSTSAEACSQVHGHGFGHESWAGIKVENTSPVGGGISGLLKQFAFGRRKGLLATIDASGRQLPKVVLGGVAVLTLQQYRWLRTGFINSQHNYRAGVVYDIATRADASRLLYIVCRDPEDGATVYGAGRNYTCLAARALIRSN